MITKVLIVKTLFFLVEYIPVSKLHVEYVSECLHIEYIEQMFVCRVCGTLFACRVCLKDYMHVEYVHKFKCMSSMWNFRMHVEYVILLVHVEYVYFLCISSMWYSFCMSSI